MPSPGPQGLLDFAPVLRASAASSAQQGEPWPQQGLLDSWDSLCRGPLQDRTGGEGPTSESACFNVA